MFLNIDLKPADSIAAVDDTGAMISYGELVNFCTTFYSFINQRSLVFILAENTIGSMAGYVAAMSGHIVPLILGSNINKNLIENLISTYKPPFLWVPQKSSGDFAYTQIFADRNYLLLATGYPDYPTFEDLSLLLPTSGSTGSPKLVRHSYTNVSENAKNVATFFELKTTDRAIAILPMQYTMGLSVISSHLYAGATLLLVQLSLTDGLFWKFIKEQKATSFTGVPYSFEILHKLRFFKMDLPELQLLTQGGGKLGAQLFEDFANFAAENDKKFIATYGQTEGTARMAYLPAEMASVKIGSIGKAIPNGCLKLIDANGKEIETHDVEGELVYSGANVTLGYAMCGEDLLKGDEFKGVLHTGDIAKKDAEGYYYICGRMSRFLKLFGVRVGLDEVEKMVTAAFDTDCVCGGNDIKMKVHITNGEIVPEVTKFILEKTGLFHMALEVVWIASLSRNEYGKVIYN